MATGFSKSSIQKASDLIYDYVCSPCEENDFNSEAVYFCKQCSKQYCDKCVAFHNGMYKNHTLLDHNDLQHWGKVKRVVVAMEMCEEHDEKLKAICVSHDQLCCTLCVSTNHSSCKSVKLIQDVAKGVHKKSEFKKLSSNVTKMTTKLNQTTEDKKKNHKAIQDTCDQILSTIQGMRMNLNQSLDQLEIQTVDEMNKLLEKMENNIHEDIDNCNSVRDGLKNLLRGIQDKAAQQESLSYIGFKKCQKGMSEGEQLVQDIQEYKIEFDPDRNIEQYLSSISSLGQFQTEPIPKKTTKQSVHSKTYAGNTDQSVPGNKIPKDNANQSIPVDSVTKSKMSGAKKQSQSQTKSNTDQLMSEGSASNKDNIYTVHTRVSYPVNVTNDKEKCIIYGICQLPSGDVVITDKNNKKVKLLNQSCAVIDQCDVPQWPWNICHIAGMEVAVAVNSEYDSRHEIHFINVRNGEMELTRQLKFDHTCYRLAHHSGNLYVGTMNAIYVYTTSGNKVKCLYEDNSGGYSTVRNIVVSDDGQMIYIVDMDEDQLVMLDNQGKQLATLSDPNLQNPTDVCMAGNGHVFICDYASNTVLQVDATGRQKLATVISCDGEVDTPVSLFFNRTTSQLIVGQKHNNNIVVFTMK